MRKILSGIFGPLLVAVFVFTVGRFAFMADGEVLTYQKISDTDGTFTATLDDGDNFGSSVANIGDLNDDGVIDLVVGAKNDDDGGSNRGAVYILFMNANGTVASYQKISDTDGGFDAVIDDSDNFGVGVAALGDLNGDGVEDIAVSASGDDDGGAAGNRGAVYVLFLDSDGTLDATAGVSGTGWSKISDDVGDWTITLDANDRIGNGYLDSIGDLNGDGVVDLIVGAPNDDDGGGDMGAVYIFFLDADGTLDNTTGFAKISDTTTGFSGVLSGAGTGSDQFGVAVGSAGDLNGDGRNEIAAGAYLDDTGLLNAGCVYVFFLNTNGTISSYQQIAIGVGGFPSGPLEAGDGFGTAVSTIGDLNGDGVPELAVGAFSDDDENSTAGAIYVLFMDPDGTLDATAGASGAGYTKISGTSGNFTATLDASDQVGAGDLGAIGDLDGDDIVDFAMGVYPDDDGGNGRGAVYVMFMDGVPDGDSTSPTVGGGGAITVDGDFFSSDLSWTASTDETSAQSALVYKVYFAEDGADLDSVADIEANGTLLSTQTDDVTYTHSGLQPNTTYTYNVIVSDEAGNKTAYTQTDGSTLYPSQSNQTFPNRPYFAISGDGCSSERLIEVEFGGKYVSDVVISDDPDFIGAQWTRYDENSLTMVDDPSIGTGYYPVMRSTYLLPARKGDYTLYARVRTAHGNQSPTMTDTVSLKNTSDCSSASGDQEEDLFGSGVGADREKTITVGAFVRSKSLPDVYYIDNSMTRRPVYNEQVLKTWGARVQTLEDDMVAGIPIGSSLIPAYGTTLVQFSGRDTIYLIDRVVSEGVDDADQLLLRPIASSALVEEIFGKEWGKKVLVLPESMYSSMPFGKAVNGFDLRYQKEGKKYRIWR